MLKYKDVKVSEYEISLAKMLGKKIKDVRGYISKEFGDLTFKLSNIELEDGTKLSCEGEHDFPYIPDIDDELLENIYKTDPDYDAVEEDDGND
jgi:hypothetical protein